MPMTSRERLQRLFRGDEVDRIPIWLLAPYHPIPWYPDIYTRPGYARLIPYIERYCDTFDRRYYSRGFCYSASDAVTVHKEETESVDGAELRETVSCGKLKLSRSITRTSTGARVDSLVKSIEDLDIILEMPYEPLQPDLSAYYREKDELGDRGLMMLDLGDPLEVLYHTMSAEDFSIYSITEYDRIIEFTDEMYRRVYDWYRYFLEQNVGEVFFIVGAEFAGPPLVSPDKFNHMSARYVKGLVDLVRSYGKWSIVHYHGNLSRVLHGMKHIGMDGLHTIESPPMGDCTITEARRVLGEKTVLIGNIQYSDLCSLEPSAIDLQVRNAIQEGRTGRFILSPSAGPYDPDPDDRLIDNYIAFIEAGIRYGITERVSR